MKLSLLSASVFSCDPYGDLRITSVTDRSDRVIPGSLFVAIPGRTRDGHRFLSDALAKGAAVLVVSEPVGNLPVPVFRVSDPRSVYARLCGNFYGNPGKSMTLIGVTGTNGKTSTACMLEYCLRSCGVSTLMIGTVTGAEYGHGSMTTPDPLDLHRIFSDALKAGKTHAVMEVSSQALDQSRTAGMEFDLGVFTNLSVDHLDYHGSMQAYRDAKLKLFSQCRKGLVNADSDYAAPFLALPGVSSFSASHAADFRAERVYMTGEGVSYSLRSPSGRREVFLPVWGRFSIYNSLAALAAAELLGLDPDRCVRALSGFPGVPGRMEPIRTDLPFRLMIDYAHTPDGLENLLRSVRETTKGRVIAVFGCGGDRDRGKRPEMGRIATRYADLAVVTSDNPRSEDPMKIIEEILAGAEGEKVRVVPDRKEAIRFALRAAAPGDAVILAGKGHERWQIFADGSVRCDEREIAQEILKEEGY